MKFEMYFAESRFKICSEIIKKLIFLPCVAAKYYFERSTCKKLITKLEELFIIA
jgi:hypothetical protein